jgi:hypothetical protein
VEILGLRREPVSNLARDDCTSELADMIKRRINIGGVHIAVNPDPAYGWHATVITAPGQAVQCQQLAEQIASQLRNENDLKVG